jgi:hypothetical protein
MMASERLIMMQSSLRIGGTSMVRSRRALSQHESSLFIDSSSSSVLFYYTRLSLMICAILFLAASGNGQASAKASAVNTNSKDCDGQTALQKSQAPSRSQKSVTGITGEPALTTSTEPQSGSDTVKDNLRLSTKTEADGKSELQGQFCKRDRSDQTAPPPPAISPMAAAQSSPTPSVAPQPVAVVTGQGLTIRASGQEFSSVLDAIRTVTGITVDMPTQDRGEPVFMTLGPVSTKDALVALLEGTRYNYVIVGSDRDPRVVTRVILSERSSSLSSPLIASAEGGSVAPQPELYGGQGTPGDAEAQSAEPPPPIQPPNPPAVIPSSVPTGINIQQLAAQSGKTTGQILDELQKHQLQVLDDQLAAQPQAPQ